MKIKLMMKFIFIMSYLTSQISMSHPADRNFQGSRWIKSPIKQKSIIIGKQGGSSTGGGGYVLNDGFPRLIDFYQITNGTEQLSRMNQMTKTEKITNELALSSNQAISELSVFNSANKIIENWSQVSFSPVFALVPSGDSNNILWHFTEVLPSDSQQIIHTRAIDRIQKTQIRTHAYFQLKPQMSRVDILLTVWNRLPFSDQVGTVIHENLRFTQITLGYQFDDLALQKATAMLLICQPSIQRSQFLLFLLSNKEIEADKQIGSYLELTHDCWK